jgi:hypothetical protein
MKLSLGNVFQCVGNNWVSSVETLQNVTRVLKIWLTLDAC